MTISTLNSSLETGSSITSHSTSTVTTWRGWSTSYLWLKGTTLGSRQLGPMEESTYLLVADQWDSIGHDYAYR